MKFTWSDQKSIILTRVVVAGTIAGCGIMTVSGPWLTRWMVSANALPPASGPVLLGMGYVCAVLAFVMLVSLYKFLRRIEGGRGLCARQRDGPAAHQLVLCGGGGGLPGRGVHLSAVCVSGRGRGVHGAHCPGAEKRLCPGRPHEGRA